MGHPWPSATCPERTANNQLKLLPLPGYIKEQIVTDWIPWTEGDQTPADGVYWVTSKAGLASRIVPKTPMVVTGGKITCDVELNGIVALMPCTPPEPFAGD